MMNKENIYKWKWFNEARLILYLVLITNFIIVYKYKPIASLCDNDNKYCSLCGMRNAVDKLMTLDFLGAYNSNKYIFIVLLCFIFIIADCTYICIKKFKK